MIVAFFRDEKQTPDNKLGEVLLPIVAAQSVQDVEYIWQVTREDMMKGQVRPSYQIYLKGSLQRISSVTANENK